MSTEIIPPSAVEISPPTANPPHMFQPGQSGNAAGRPPGQNKTTRLLREAVMVAAELAGQRIVRRELAVLVKEYGKDLVPPEKLAEIEDANGLVRYLLHLAENEPKSFAAMLARVMPLQLAGEFKVGATQGLAALMEAVNGRTRSIEK